MSSARASGVDARSAILAKALPKIYGDKLAVASKHELVDGDGRPVNMIPIAQRLAFILSLLLRGFFIRGYCWGYCNRR